MICYVTPVLVRLVRIWEPSKAVSVERKQSPGGVRRRIMTLDGAVDRFVAMSCLAENMHVQGLAMRDFAELVRKRWKPDATVAKSRRK